ncbi:MAG: TIM-barrel domain-containing protein [Haloarculaceae archaeon]
MPIETRRRGDGEFAFAADGDVTRLRFVSEGVVRLTHARGEPPDPDSLIVRDGAGTGVDASVTEHADRYVLSGPELRVEVDAETGAVAWRTADGRRLLSEAPGGGKTLDAVSIDDLTGGRDVAGPRESTDRDAYEARFAVEFGDEALYGLGQHEEGVADYRGESQVLYQDNRRVSAPALVSTNGYGLLWDAAGLSAFHDDRHGSYVWTECVDQLDLYFVYGPDLDDVVAGFRELTGESTLFPKWAYGYVQSRERYETGEELVSVAEEYRDRGVPLDVLVQDWQYWPREPAEGNPSGEPEWLHSEGEAHQWGQKSFDPDRFPDPEGTFDRLHDLDVNAMISVWPNMIRGPNHDEMAERGHLLDDAGAGGFFQHDYYDVFDADARELYWQQAREGLWDRGIDGWWCDSTEPYDPTFGGGSGTEPFRRASTVADAFYRVIDPGYVNAYSLQQARAMYEGQRATTDEKRVLNLTRSGYPGQQRYGAITWSGDIEATWDRFEQQIADGLQFTATGNPNWTLDIGAFIVGEDDWPDRDLSNGRIGDLGYRELYTRWFQFGTFLPMLRSHGTDTPREVWRFGEPGDRFYDTIVKFDELRYRLLPYIYSLAGWETHREYTMFRHLAFDFRADDAVHDVADQFMFGPALMVCPVTEPMYYGPGSDLIEGRAKAREVYLPAGTDWFDFWTGESYDGGQSVLADAPLEKVPLFVPAGSILPMGPVQQHTGEKPDAPWQVRVYPGGDGKFDLYEDAGDGYDYEDGQFAWTPLEWDDAAGELRIGAREGSFPELVEEREIQAVLAGEGRATGKPRVDESGGTSVTYDGTAVTVSTDR